MFVCRYKEETAVVIARKEACARRTLKLIKGGDRVIIHYGPLETDAEVIAFN